jgi:threonine dehydratase
MNHLAVNYSDVQAAAQRLIDVAQLTPLLPVTLLDARLDATVHVKAEVLQIGGSFKFRGAYNRLVQLDAAARGSGVVAWSSGNHAQGVAAAAARLAIPATIVMPSDAPAIKIDKTRELGADILFYDRMRESREVIATALAERSGAVLVPSFDDPYIIAGQGTTGIEIANQSRAAGGLPDIVLVCCGGGGLVAGIATALAELAPDAAVYSVEPEGYDDTARSLATGIIQHVDPAARSICDALLAPHPGTVTFPLNHTLLAGGLVVTDAEVRAAMRFAFRELKLVVEPGGAVALAALLAGKIEVAGKRVVAVLSGGNVDSAQFAEILQASDQ